MHLALSLTFIQIMMVISFVYISISVISNGLYVQSRQAQDPSPQFIRNYFSAFANDPILTSVRGVEKLEAGTPDGESDEKEKVEEMEKDAVVTRYFFDLHHCNVINVYFCECVEYIY